MSRSAASTDINTPEAAQQTQKTWSHPGGKLVEMGSNTLKQAELLAILIGSGTPGRPAIDIANAILDIYIGLYGIHQQATIEDLARIPGMGPRKAARILAAIEMGRRVYKRTRPQNAAPQAEKDLFTASTPPPDKKTQPQGPTDVDLITEIIGSGIKGRPAKVIAKSLLSRYGSSIMGLYDQDMGDFLRIKGLDSVKIIRICASLEIANRISHAIA